MTNDPPKPTHKDSPAAKSLRSLQQQHANAVNEPQQSEEASSLSKLKDIATSEEFQNVLVSAAVYATNTTTPPNEYLANLPPLHPQSTAKNFSRFVSRCGPMFSFRDNVILLLSWHKPMDTLAALLVYCLICKIEIFVSHFYVEPIFIYISGFL